MTPARQPHTQRCETCKKLWKTDCPYYAWVKTGEVGISCDSYIEFTAIVGCASHISRRHTSAPAPTDHPLTEEQLVFIIECERAEAAKAAREQFASAIIPALGRAIQTDISDNDYVMMEDLESTIGLLRQQEAGQPKEPQQ